MPHLCEDLTDRYIAWLKARYGSQDKLAAAWGSALKPNETLDAGTLAWRPIPGLSAT